MAKLMAELMESQGQLRIARDMVAWMGHRQQLQVKGLRSRTVAHLPIVDVEQLHGCAEAVLGLSDIQK